MPTHAAIFFFPFNPGISNFPFFKQFFLKLPLLRRRKGPQCMAISVLAR